MRRENPGRQIALKLPVREQGIEAQREKSIVRSRHGHFFHGILLKTDPAVGAGAGGLAAAGDGSGAGTSAGSGGATGDLDGFAAATAPAMSRANSWARW